MDSALDTCFAAKVKQEKMEEESDSEREEEKDRLTNVLGLMKTVLLPRLGNLIGWKQKKRLREPKPTSYTEIAGPGIPQSSVSGFSSHPGVQVQVSPSEAAASAVLLPSSGLRRSSRNSKGKSKASEAELGRTQFPQSIRNIRAEQVDPVSVSLQVSDPASMGRAKRQSKPAPNQFLDSAFPFGVSHPAGGATFVIKKEEVDKVDICSTSHHHQRPRRTLRTRQPPARSAVKREREERSVSTNLERLQPKSPKRRSGVTKPTRPPAGQAGPLQLQTPQHKAQRAQKKSHSCLQCEASYQDCVALVMHRLRHTEGKHWPCPLCCKNFHRMTNVRSHIRTHEPKLYKCRSCIVAGL